MFPFIVMLKFVYEEMFFTWNVTWHTNAESSISYLSTFVTYHSDWWYANKYEGKSLIDAVLHK